ncbi:protoporphyrinogen oxidase HemJ [Oricola cellulosilytica]|uniref:Protoporphyrinogen IX oxidase n=1 Tax=Oricola cellulosilytica TaxID=1429082 RepID=A0A4R0PDX4_9HYPH|nr:protoporphyrinogen oxidase HemJ [Oricola cellulosilytica]TCD15986.1 protoporphyrinogen oxidase HemJ [Oricola cellulosilytica]
MDGQREVSEGSGRTAARRAAMAMAVFVAIMGLIFWLNPSGIYLWVKAVHVIAIIAWMAGMLYLPRLFVYHCEAKPGSEQSETFKIMERRLLRVIMNPAMIIAWALGLWLAWSGGYFLEPWFWGKFLAVVAMSGVHGSFSKAVRLFAEDRNRRSARYWRIMNEVPTVLMIAAVVLVIVKPF